MDNNATVDDMNLKYTGLSLAVIALSVTGIIVGTKHAIRKEKLARFARRNPVETTATEK